MNDIEYFSIVVRNLFIFLPLLGLQIIYVEIIDFNLFWKITICGTYIIFWILITILSCFFLCSKFSFGDDKVLVKRILKNIELDYNKIRKVILYKRGAYNLLVLWLDEPSFFVRNYHAYFKIVDESTFKRVDESTLNEFSEFMEIRNIRFEVKDKWKNQIQR